MENKTKLAIILGIFIPSGVIVLILLIIWLVRRIQYWRNYSGQGYNQVRHDLDEEEIEFKRILDAKGDLSYEIDDLESQRNEVDEDYERLIKNKLNTTRSNNGKSMDREVHLRIPDDSEDDLDFEFSAKEKDRLSLLEKFRSNLVAEADHRSSPASSDNISNTSAAKPAGDPKQGSGGAPLSESKAGNFPVINSVDPLQNDKEVNENNADEVVDIFDHKPSLGQKEFEDLKQFYSNSDSEKE